MGKTKRAFQTVYLDQDKFELFKKLSTETRIPRSVLAREAIDDLLIKYARLEEQRGKP
jgi:hypothetical protein